MKRFRPYGENAWFFLPRAHNPDIDILNYERQSGEFSLVRLEAFERNCRKLNYDVHTNPYFKRYNGSKMRMVLQNNKLFYGKAGLEELVSKR